MEKITRPFTYDLNQIPYDYTVEMKNRFKGLDLIDRVPDELWTEVHDIVCIQIFFSHSFQLQFVTGY